MVVVTALVVVAVDVVVVVEKMVEWCHGEVSLNR